MQSFEPEPRLACRVTAQGVLVLEQNAQRALDRLGVERDGVELAQRAGPLEQLLRVGSVRQVGHPQASHEGCDRGAQIARSIGQRGVEDVSFTQSIRVVAVVMNAVPADTVGDVSGVVRGDDREWRTGCLHPPELFHPQSMVLEDLVENRLERGTRRLESFDQQHARHVAPGGAQGAQQGPLDEVVGTVEILLALKPQAEQLTGVIPSEGCILSLHLGIHREFDQLRPEEVCQARGKVRLSSAARAFEQQRSREPDRQGEGLEGTFAGDVAGLSQTGADRLKLQARGLRESESGGRGTRQ